MDGQFIDHVKNIIAIDNECFDAYFQNLTDIYEYQKKNGQKSAIAIFLDKNFKLSEKKFFLKRNKNAKKFENSFAKRQAYFYKMEWGFDSKEEMFRVYDHVSTKLKHEHKDEKNVIDKFNANKQLLSTIMTFEEQKINIISQNFPEEVYNYHMRELEIAFAYHVAAYNNKNGTKYSTQYIKMH